MTLAPIRHLSGSIRLQIGSSSKLLWLYRTTHFFILQYFFSEIFWLYNAEYFLNESVETEQILKFLRSDNRAFTLFQSWGTYFVFRQLTIQCQNHP